MLRELQILHIKIAQFNPHNKPARYYHVCSIKIETEARNFTYHAPNREPGNSGSEIQSQACDSETSAFKSNTGSQK